MNISRGVELFYQLQNAFQVISVLQLNGYMWPKQSAVQDNTSFDFIVVGAGTAGSVLASLLVKDGKSRVLLIEAGGNPPFETNIPETLIYLDKSKVDWGYTSENDGYSSQCQTNHNLDLLMGKMLGGTGSLDFLLFGMGNRLDYDNWADITKDSTWCWDSVKPYFLKSLKFKLECNSNYTLRDFRNFDLYYGDGKVNFLKPFNDKFDIDYLKAFKEAGNKIVPYLDAENSLGYTETIFGIGKGVRQSTAYTYLRQVKDYPNLYVLKNTVAKKIIFDNHKNAIGVEIVTKEGNTITVKAEKEVIVSAGAINGPKLLMLSGIGPAKHLINMGIKVISDLPVGQNLQDHVTATVVYNMTKLDAPMQARDSRNYPARVYTGCSNLDKTKEYPESCSINFRNYAQFLIQFCAVTYGLNEKICENLFGEYNTNEMLYSMISVVRPKSRGSVLLRSNNYTDPPKVFTGFYSDKRDLDTMVTYIQNFLQVSNTSSFKALGGKFLNPKLEKCKTHKFGSTDYWRCYALCMMSARRYFCGTNAMTAVVDSRLRVLGVNKLRVVDASVMPVIPSSDTFAPVVMIAEKGVDFIKSDHHLK